VAVKVVESCPNLTYTQPPPPDKIRMALANRKQYQLVIAADTFELAANSNRAYVGKTGELVSGRLSDLGYSPLPSLERERIAFLSGRNASKARVWDAIKEMADLVDTHDVGLIYYVGHGSVAPNPRDLSLAVYDKLVEADEGIRVSDIITTLSLRKFPGNVEEIPKFILVLETCYSGLASSKSGVKVVDQDGLKTLAEANTGLTPPPPKQMVLLSASANGDSRAFELKSTNVSAFGYFFVRALREEWACADLTPDGVITVFELENYLKKRLAAAFKANLIEGEMAPLARDDQRVSFLAYDEAKYFTDGVRDSILDITVQPPFNQISTIQLPDGEVRTCPPECTAMISTSARSEIRVRSRQRFNDAASPSSAGGGDFGIFLPTPPPPPPPRESVVTVGELRGARGRSSIGLQGGGTILVR
jgi:hypothetical protein